VIPGRADQVADDIYRFKGFERSKVRWLPRPDFTRLNLANPEGRDIPVS
jgi:hypothetical protein